MKRRKADLVRGWPEKASGDLVTAMKELEAVEPFTDIVSFHAQLVQGGESQ